MSDLPARLRALSAERPGLEIVTDGDLLAERGHDYWMRSLIRRRLGDEQRAGAVVRPASTADVSALLAWADQTGTEVIPYGLGSGVCGAIVAARDQVVVDMGRMAEIIEINDVSLTATVRAGMRGSEFEAGLQQRGLTMGHFPQSIELSTVGGWCSTRAAGQFSTLYGNIEDMLLGCEFVIPGGTVLRLPAVPRASTGPDLKQLLLGSEGEFGIFTELVFRVHPLAEATRGQCFAFAGLGAAIDALRLILRAGWQPAVTRLYDATEAERNFSESVGDGGALLLLLSEGPEARVTTEADALRALVEAHGGVDRGSDAMATWLENRNHVPSFEMLLDQGLVVDTIEVAAGWDRLTALWESVVAEGMAVPGMLAMSGHVSHCYTQGANIYFTFVAAAEELERRLEIYDQSWELTMRATRAQGGTIAHHHGIGRVRKRWLGEELGAARELLVRLKRAFDPKGIMNPGALIDLG
jgi:alkyldihydroxyacetonephosphate synthase